MNPKVIFVGAGPVGLMTAIQAKLYDPDLPILMLEKYPEYKRKHILHLEQSSFADSHPDQEFQNFVKSLPSSIRTNELEDALLVYAKKLGIVIEYAEVKSCKELAQHCPSAEIIVGADGSHSIVHEQIFNHEYQIQKTLQHIAELKYEVQGDTRPLNKIMEVVPALTYTRHLISEFVGKENDKKTPVSLRLFIDETTYEKMKNATFKNPYHLSDIQQSQDQEIKALNESINAWLTARKDLANEQRIENSERLTTTHLPVYASKEFVNEGYAGKTWFLVGDAAFGVPYFRSLNNGILCSSQLAKAIHAGIHHQSIPVETFSDSSSFSSSSVRQEETPAENYRNFIQRLVVKERWLAEAKSMGVTSLQVSAASSRAMPVPRMKLLKTAGGRNFKSHMQGDEPSSLSSCSMFSSSFSSATKDKTEQQDEQTMKKKAGCTIL